ncbi:hypothetical protein ARMGADRAFT_940433, partial [Armillaria gallica]
EAVDISNRYFWPKAKMSDDNGIQIVQEIDPNRILHMMGNNTLIYMEDNVVQYCKRVTEDGKKQYTKVKLQIFRGGDIIEVQCSMVFITTINTLTRMNLVLCALAMVNCQVSTHNGK